jgi:hypothetical protein
MNKTRYKSLDRIAADPRVREIWSEEGMGDGLWISLADGWNKDGASVVHEWSAKDLREAFRHIAEGPTY